MRKKKVDEKPFVLRVEFLREGKMYIAYSPALDLSTCGKTFQEAKKNIKEAVGLFFEECEKDGNLKEVLESLGWIKSNKNGLEPPIYVGQDNVEIPQLSLA